MTKEELNVITKERYELMKRRAEKHGIKFLTKYRKGIKTIKLEPIVLGINHG